MTREYENISTNLQKALDEIVVYINKGYVFISDDFCTIGTRYALSEKNCRTQIPKKLRQMGVVREKYRGIHMYHAKDVTSKVEEELQAVMKTLTKEERKSICGSLKRNKYEKNSSDHLNQNWYTAFLYVWTA